MRRTKSTLQNCDIVTAGGFQKRTAAESSLGSNVSCLRSTRDEADTWIILHARTLTTQGFKRIVVHSRDTDVLVLLVHFANQLSPELWFRTGTAKQRTYVVVVHSRNIDQALSKTIPAFHALTGCDTVSQLCGIGKNNGLEDIQTTLLTAGWPWTWDSVMKRWQMPKSSFVGYTRAMKLTLRSKVFGSNSSTNVQKTLRSYLRLSLRCKNTSSEHTTSVTSTTGTTSDDWRAISWRVPSTNAMPV